MTVGIYFPLILLRMTLKARRHCCVSTDLMKAIDAEVKPDATVFGPGGYMEGLSKIFDILYPIFYRRVQLFKLRQSGEDALAYMDRICCHSLKVEYETLDREAFWVLHFATTFDDERLRNKLIAMDNPTKENNSEICVDQGIIRID